VSVYGESVCVFVWSVCERERKRVRVCVCVCPVSRVVKARSMPSQTGQRFPTRGQRSVKSICPPSFSQRLNVFWMENRQWFYVIYTRILMKNLA